MPDFVYPLIGIPLIFACTTLGALFVFFIRKKEISPRLNKIFIGFAAGVMFSASFFSLIKPALETNVTSENKDEGLEAKRMSKTSKMFLAVTIHNIPEGLSVGIAFGVALSQPDNHALLIGALLLAIGIGIQNIPEGAVVSLPVKAETGSSGKAFVFGMLSGVVEPIAAVLGLFLAMQIQGIMPWALAFAAGCMIYVVAEEMIPEMTSEGHDHFGVWSFVAGFVNCDISDCS